MRWLTRLIWIIPCLLVLAFGLKNLQPATVYGFGGSQWDTSMIYLVLVLFVAGLIVGLLAMLPVWLGLRWRLHRANLDVKRLKGELASARHSSALVSLKPKAAVAAEQDDHARA
ncbi:LapA family protein [Amphibiibacter pelophylacis]|uniref:LapA family protein n=1 Tax=Amphibiibacter pelophylacis TaxID=1799477 RepID=A0ACC6P2F3_9BURK